MHNPHQPSWRKPFGIFVILSYILLVAIIVAQLTDFIFSLPFFVQMLIFVFAGIIWIYPLKPLMIWMETGKWRAPKNEED